VCNRLAEIYLQENGRQNGVYNVCVNKRSENILENVKNVTKLKKNVCKRSIKTLMSTMFNPKPNT